MAAEEKKKEVMLRLALPRRVLLKEGDLGGLKPFDERKAFADDPEYATRWPINQDDKADDSSANHKQHEAFLDAQEWPGPSNNWHSRRGHPLNPTPGEPRRVEWTHSYSLDAVQRVDMPPHSAPADDAASDAGATTGPAEGILVAQERTRHLLRQPAQPAQAATRHVIFGGGCEALDMEYARVSGLRGEAAPLEYQRILHTRSERLHQRGAALADPEVGRAHAAEALQQSRQRLQPFVDAGVHLHGGGPLLQRGGYLLQRADGTTPAAAAVKRPSTGFRPGSAAARRANGSRPAPWPDYASYSIDDGNKY